jgi:hypothetical protein
MGRAVNIDEIRLEILRGAFETVRRGEDGPYLAENTLTALNSPPAIRGGQKEEQ